MHTLPGSCPEQGLTLHLPDSTGCARSDASSQVSFDMGLASSLGVSNSVAGQLSAAGLNHVQQLLPAIRHLAAVLECATPAGSPEASSILSQLGQVHLCIVEVDDALDRQQLATELDECRQWLKQVQGYLLSLHKQVQDLAATETQQCEAASTTSSMDEVSGSSNSSTAGTAACDTAWRVMCQDAADALSRLADQLCGGASSDFDSPRTVGSAQGSSKLVARQSRLSYSQYWSKKIAL